MIYSQCLPCANQDSLGGGGVIGKKPEKKRTSGCSGIAWGRQEEKLPWAQYLGSKIPRQCVSRPDPSFLSAISCVTTVLCTGHYVQSQAGQPALCDWANGILCGGGAGLSAIMCGACAKAALPVQPPPRCELPSGWDWPYGIGCDMQGRSRVDVRIVGPLAMCCICGRSGKRLTIPPYPPSCSIAT